MKLKQIILFSLISCCVWVACNPSKNQKDSIGITDDQNNKASDETSNEEQRKEESEFLVYLASTNRMLIQMSDLALQRAASPDTKKFAQEVKKNHQLLLEEVKSIALQKNYTLPTTPGDSEQGKINALQEFVGVDCDETYVAYVEETYDNYQNDLEEVVVKTSDANIKSMVFKVLNNFRAQQEKAKTLAQTLENTAYIMKN